MLLKNENVFAEGDAAGRVQMSGGSCTCDDGYDNKPLMLMLYDIKTSVR